MDALWTQHAAKGFGGKGAQAPTPAAAPWGAAAPWPQAATSTRPGPHQANPNPKKPAKGKGKDGKKGKGNEARGDSICHNFLAGTCTGETCPHSRKHEWCSKAEFEALQAQKPAKFGSVVYGGN